MRKLSLLRFMHFMPSSGFIKLSAVRKFIVCFMLLLTFGFINYTFASIEGPGSTWTYYRTIALSPATPSANFQVDVLLTTGQYTNMKSDGSDLRFYDDAGNNCPYWIETWNNTGNSVIWVKVPTSGSDVLVMYYGNASATAVSDGASTFDFFDDFAGTRLRNIHLPQLHSCLKQSIKKVRTTGIVFMLQPLYSELILPVLIMVISTVVRLLPGLMHRSFGMVLTIQL